MIWSQTGFRSGKEDQCIFIKRNLGSRTVVNNLCPALGNILHLHADVRVALRLTPLLSVEPNVEFAYLAAKSSLHIPVRYEGQNP